MRKTLVPAAAFLSFAVLATPASAITCDGNFQLQRNGQPIATPYCEDNNLAAVAREYGMRVSASAVRANPSVKEQACRLVGDDNRVRDTCAPYRMDLPRFDHRD